ncbi:MAG: hypothetical protein D6732_13975 [Methanobacteriota archaeon]|nr:MAG: hypothetical protein D6732_13975 [Euryarchaeota archaeon]
MRLRILDLLVCPKCADETEPFSRKYSIQGDFNETKIFDGFVKCPKGHKWQVRDELLKFDKISTDDFLYAVGDIEYGEVNKFPTEIEGLEKDFINLNREAASLALNQKKLIAVRGSPLIFLESLENVDRPIIIINPDEKVLRQCQEIAAKNGFFDYLSVVKANAVTYSDPSRIFEISIIEDAGMASIQIIKKDEKLILLNNS